MTDLLFIAFVSVTVIYADFWRSKDNTGTPFNGFGCVRSVVEKRAKLPMQHRVFVPVLTALYGGSIRAYMCIKWVGIAFATVGVFRFFILYDCAYIGTSLMALFWVLASQYDYADAYWEMGMMAVAFAALFEGYVVAFVAMTALATTNRETSVVLPVAAFAVGDVVAGIYSLAAFVTVYGAINVYYGRPVRYCSFNMIGFNLARLRESYATDQPIVLNEYTHFFLIVFASVLAYVLAPSVTPFAWVMAGFGISMLVPSVWREIRVFGPVMLAVIPLLVRQV